VAEIMIYRRWLAGLLAFAMVSGLAAASKKKKKNEEEITQTLPVLQDPPPTVTAEVERLGFRIAPLSPKGLLSQQVRDGLKVLIRDSRGSIVKIRAFVAGTGDIRRVQTIVSETFGEKKLQVPALSTIQGGALPGEGVQVALEAIEANKKPVNPNGLAFISGQPADTIEESVGRLNTVLRGLAIPNNRMLKVTCFVSSLEYHAQMRTAVTGAFPTAAANYVQMQRLPVRPQVECEGVAALENPIGGDRMKLVNPTGIEASPNYAQAVLIGPGRVVISGTQMGFGTQDADIRLAFDRLGRSLDAAQASYKSVVFTHVYPVSEAAANQFRALRFNYLDKTHPPASTLLPFEGLPSLDASFGMDVIAVR
jgi:enamine deaminase RidA (YjgF/YER057c/UK114 family)